MHTKNNEKLKSLLEKKGIISRKIGQLKNNNEPIDQLIHEIQGVSIEIKKLKNEIKRVKTLQESKLETSSKLVPSQFKPRILNDGPVDLHVTRNINSDEWDLFVNEHPNSSLYHSTSIRRVIKDTFGHDCIYLAVEDKDHVIQGILPLIKLNSRLFGHFIISVPFFNYGGMLVRSKAAENKLFNAAKEIALESGASHIEYRHTFHGTKYKARTDKITMLRQLPDSTDLFWQDIGSKVRAQITKAKSYNMTAETGKSELINDFYTVFSQNMRDLGTPVYAKKFFINMMSNCENAHIVIIYHKSRPVSAAFLLGWRDTMEIPWASTLRKYNRMNANMLLYWTVLKHSIKLGFKIFDFGRSNKDSGTYRFKKQWGAEAHQLYWHYWLRNDSDEPPKINPGNPKYKLMIYVWTKLPVWLTKIIGPGVVKYLP